jgi:amidase
MQTTAGSLALVGNRSAADAFLVQQLRNAGAVILGKTNLSEWSNGRGLHSVSGWSSRGGLTRNPHALDRSASGSSSGSAAAVAASLCAAAVGTETDGSLLSPAAVCGVVALKTTVGLISRRGVIPISMSMDTPGPIARSVYERYVRGLQGLHKPLLTTCAQTPLCMGWANADEESEFAQVLTQRIQRAVETLDLAQF